MCIGLFPKVLHFTLQKQFRWGKEGIRYDQIAALGSIRFLGALYLHWVGNRGGGVLISMSGRLKINWKLISGIPN